MNVRARFSGKSLIANGQGNITFDGATATTEESDLLTVISAGDITFNGSSATRGQFLTARDFTYNGNSTLYGAIAAKQNITFNGGGEVIATAAPQVTVDNLTIVEGDDGSKSAVVTVNLSRGSILTTEIDYTTVDGTAEAGSDYEAVAGKLSFEPLATSKTIVVPILGDKIDEIDEAFTIELNHTQSTVTITDDDAPPEIVIGDLSIVEGDVGTKTAFVTVTLSNPSSFPIAVDYTTEDNTAEAGVDYGAVSGRLEFAPGEASKVISVPIIGDNLDEVDKELIVKLTNPNNATIADDRGTITIEDNDEAPDLSISSELVTEGDTGIKQAEFTVMLSNPSGKEISVDFNTVEGTASAGIDYTASAGTLIFAPGEISKTITVDILGDNLDEIDEAFTIELANPNNVTLSNNLATGTIIDNDLPPEISIENIEVTEGDNSTSNATITINLDRPSSLPISVDYATEDNTAVAGSDYNAIAGTVDFAPGETSKTISIAIAGDRIDEYDETLGINLTNASNATIATNTGTVTILDDDAPAKVSVGDVTLVEGDEGSTNALFTVSLDVESAKPISIDFTTVDGTGIAGEDYVGVSGKLEFAPGETTKTIEVAVLGDKLDELDEAFTIHLSNPRGADILNNHGTGTIVNNDNPPTVSVENLTIAEGDSGTTEAVFTVSLSEASGKEITIDYSTVDGDAVAGIDYETESGTLTFAPGETSKTIAVTVNGDNLDELDEAFFLQIENGVNVAIEETQITGTIVDDDNPPELSIEDITVTEGTNGTSTAIFTVNLDNPSSKEITLDYATADGSATAGKDYIATNGTLTFAPGETTKAIAVTIQGDNLDELTEAFFLNFDNASNATLTDTQGTVTITDDDNPPLVSIGDIAVTEGDSDNTIATVTVTLDNPSSLPITVDYATADNTANAGTDYTATNGTLTFAPGETSKTISVTVNRDNLDEIDELFSINLDNAANAVIGDNLATVTIVDNDNPPELTVNNITVTEGNDGTSTAIFTVTLDNPSSKEISLDYATADGTAIAGSDYIATNGTLTFAPGETSAAIAVTIQGDTLDELDEAFTLNFTNPSNVTLVNTQGTVTITDDDDAPEIALTDISVTEGDSGSTTATITVTLDAPSSLPITVDYATADGTAIAGSDYIAQNGTIAFARGETSKTIEVEVTGDITDELDEAFTVNLSNPSNVTLTDAQSTITIVDNDLPPQIAIDDVSITEGNSGTSIATFTVTLDNASSQIVTVDYATANNTATAGEDFTAANGTLTFNPGETSKTISVVVIGDSIDELDENFNVTLANPSNGIITDSEGTATIVNDDVPPELSVADISVVEGNDGTSTAIFTVNLDNPSSKEITLDYATADGTATSGEDYTAIAGTLTFAPGETTKTIEVEVIGDILDEIDEAFALNFSNENNVTLNNSQATATIIDDDLAPEVAIADISITESDSDTTTATLTVNLNNPSSKEISIDYSTVDGTAEAGIDYITIAGTLTFAPGETSKTIEVQVIGDILDEIDEAFTVNFSNSSNVSVLDSETTVTIVDNDLPPEMAIDDVTVTEGDNGNNTATFTISLNNPSSKEITVDYATLDGTAVSEEDYTAIAGTLTFAPGETSKTIAVDIIGDNIDEIDEAFTVSLNNASNAVVVQSPSTAVIIDDDLPPALSVDDVVITETDEGTTNAVFTITLNNPSSQPITVDYTTTDGTAIAGEDYTAINGTLTFAPGETSKTVSVSIIGDRLDELDKEFSLDLSNADSATIADHSGLGTIIDNDLPPEVIVESVTVMEGEIGTKEAQFVVNLNAPSNLPITVDYATADGTAIAGEDYLATSGTIFFAPGETSKIVSVSVIGDRLDELNEAFDLNLSNITNATPDSFTATGTIADDDLPPQISIDSVIVEEGDSNPVNAIFTVSLDAPSNLPITFEYSTVDNTASAADGDYLAVNGTITFNPGETVQNIVVPVLGDLVNENDETFAVNLANPTNAIFATNKGTGTIEDNDNSAELAIEDVSVTEGDEGITTARFTVNLSQAVESTVTVDYATADESAIAGEDYTAANGTLNFAPGETSKTIEVNVIGDTADEVDEIFNVNLNNVSSTTEVLIADGTGQGTIIDNDSLINEPEGILLAEGSDFEVEYIQPLTVPSASSVITIAYSDLNFDTTDPDSINDALEFALVDENGNSLIHTIGNNQTAFFNLTEGEAAQIAPGVTLDGETVKVNLTDVLPGTTANLIARLVNNDGDVNTSVRIDNITIESGDNTVPLYIPDAVTVADPDSLINFQSLKDVTPSVSTNYQQTSFNQETQTLTANLALENQGTYWLDTPLIVAVTKISDPSVRIVGADGLTNDGLSYYDFSNLVEGERFAPGTSSEATEIAFYNPNGVQFTYELVVLSELNTAPEITSSPDLEIIGGQSYSYQVEANDIDNDALAYRLLAAPNNMSIDETTGLISWDTTTDDISNHGVVVEVSDGRGGVDLQTYNLAVIATPANRPPQFTSTPVVDAYINQPYEYDADAIDPDLDSVKYEVVNAPDGLTIDPDTGVVEWTPPSVVVLGDTVIGQINLPGEVDEFNFSGSKGQQIYFDPLQYTGRYQNWNFDVYDPNGNKIADTDLRHQNNKLVKLPETGNYRVVVSTTSSQTGSYGFSVIDLALTPVAQLDTVIEGKLSPGSEDDLYRFAGNEGQRIFIDKISNSGSVDWVLYDPQNNVVTSNSSMNDMEVVLSADGEYKLALRGKAGFTNTVDYSFEIITPDEVTAPMELGSLDSPKSVYGEITEKGERDIYTFDGVVGQRILFDRLFLNSTRYNAHSINIVDPSGRSVWNKNIYNASETTPIILQESGLYQVTIDASGENTGTYSFNLIDIDKATTVDLDTKYENTLDPGQEIHIYQFEGTESQRLFIDSLNNVSGSWRVYDSSFKTVGSNSLGGNIELVLAKNDTYYLAIFGSSNNPVDYSFELITPDTLTEAIEWNTEISRTLTEKGERDVFTFEGAVEQRLFIDSLTNNSTNLRFTLVSPDGITLFNNVQLNQDGNRYPITLAELGTYQLTIDGLDETREDYNFRLLDVDEATPVVPETNVTGMLEPGRAIQFYQFSGSAGERVYFNSQTTSSNSTVWYLYDANNQRIGGTNISTDWEYVIPADGNYYLMLRGENNTSVEYNFQIVKTVSDPVSLTLNEATNGEISLLGEQDTYTFTGSLGQTLYFDGRGNDSQISVKVYTPNGTLIHNGNGSGDSAPLTLTEGGTYQVIVDGVNSKTGNYSFALVDETDELNPDTAYDGVLDPRETVLYSFEGTAGQKLDFQSLAGNSNASWILYAPVNLPSNGKVVGNTSISSDFERVLPVDGTYVLALRNNSDVIVDFNFQVADISDPRVTKSGLDTVYEGTTNSTGTVDSYEVVANAGDLIYVDGQLGYDRYKGVRLYNPDGSSIFSANYVRDINRVYQLQQTGTFNLEAYGSSNNYRFGVIDLKAAPNLDTNTPTDITLAARETKAYQFTGSFGQQLWFDSQGATNVSYNLRIYNASGRQVGSTGRDVGLLTIEADGQYYAVIESSGTTDGTISFQLLDTANATPVEFDKEITGTNGASGYETQIYTFDGDAGQRIYVDERASSSNGNYYLYDSAGKLVNSNRLNYSHEYYELAMTGDYTLVVSAQRANNDYTINLVSSEVVASDYVVGETVTAEIVKPGNENIYNFEGTFGQQLWFDSLASSSINAALYAPSGKRIWSQSSSSDKAITNLDETGTYRLVLDGSYKTTGAYSFRMLDIADAAMTTTLDMAITGDFGESTRETQIYRFTGNKGQSLYSDRTVGYRNNNYSLYDINGTRIFSQRFDRDLENIQLPKDGEYLLVVEGRGYSGNNNNYSLEIVTPELTTNPYTLGTVIEANISEAGEKDFYTFEGEKGQKLLFDNLGTASSTNFQLFAPSGRNVLNGTLNSTDYWDNLDETGTYTLVVDGAGDTTDPYSFRLSDYQEIATGIELDTVITGDFGTSLRETQVYTFEGDEGQYLYLDRSAGYRYNYWRIYDEQNNLIRSQELDDDFELALPYTGQYTLHLSGYGNSNSDYSFGVVTPELNTTTYTIGDTVVSNIGEAGERDIYTFTVEAGQRLLFDSLESTSNINWQLLSPSGERIFGNNEYYSMSSDRTHLLSETGSYTLTFDGAGDATGDYGFRVLDWSNATQLDLNTTISGDFGEGRETNIYQFTAAEDTHLYFARTIGHSSDRWSLYNSEGEIVRGSTNLSSDFELTIPATDNYTLYVSGNDNVNNDYSFEVTTSEWIESPINLDEPVSGSIDVAGEQNIYTFDGSIGQRLFFDSLDGVSGVTAKLYSPTNKLIFDGRTDFDSSLFTLTENGSYRLVIDGSSTTVNDYSFNLKDVAAADNLDLATNISGSLDNGKEVKLYQFRGTQGTVLDFNLDAASWSGASWKLYDPGNKVIANPSVSSPDFEAALPVDGTYTLAIIGNGTEVVDYSFTVAERSLANTSNNGLHNTYSGTLVAGGVVDHVFTVTAGTQIYLDSLETSTWQVRTRLVAPDGSYVFNNHQLNTDKGAIILPQSGEYTLQTYGYYSYSTGDYNFQLLELPQDLTSNATQPLSLGTVTSGTLNGLESQIYSFDGKLGQQILFNGINGANVGAKLIAPNGSNVFDRGNYRFYNNGVHTLIQDGIYHLVIRGEQAADRDYDFQLLDLNFGSSLKLNQTTSGSLADGRENKIYSFTGKAGETIGFDFLGGSTNIRAKLYAPGNHTIVKDTYLASGYDYSLELPSDGTYTLLVEGGSSATAIDYSFRAYNLTSGQQKDVITPGTGENASGDGSLGIFPVTISASDDLGGVGIQEYNIRLLPDPDNAAPAITSVPDELYNLDKGAYRYQIDAIDPDNDDLTYSLIDSPLGTIINSDTGELIWVAEAVVVGNSYDFTVEVTDGRGGVDRQTFSVEVRDKLGTIQGLVFEDLNANGIPDTKLLKGDNPDIFFVLDVSGSMGSSSVDWLTADIQEVSSQDISPLDQEFGSIVALAEFTVAQGRGDDSQFGIIDSGGGITDMNPFEPGIQESISAGADYNNNGILDVREAIAAGLGVGGSSTDGVKTAWDLHKALPGDPNIVFMSDGFISVDEQLIADAKADGVNITAFGFAEGGMNTMRLVDPDAVYIESPQEIINIFSGFDPRYVGEPLMEGVTVYLDLNNNGVLDSDEPNQVSRQDDSVSFLGNSSNYLFSFDNLFPGTYTVRQVTPNGFIQTAPIDSFVDTITVGGGETYTHFFGNHKVEPVPNSNPIFTSLAPTDGLEIGNLFRYQATATDPDANFLSYELTLAPEGMSVDSETGTVLWQPTEEQTGTAKAILRVNDGEGGIDIQYFELSVAEPNTLPVFTSSLGDNVSPQVGKPFQYQAVAVDADLDPVTYELTGSNPSGVSIDADTGLVTWQAASNQLGATEITIKAIDDKGGEAIQTLELNVIEAQPNRAPDITSTPRNNVRIGTNYYYQPIASDPDGNPLSFNLLSAPEGMVMDDAGRLVWSPNAEQFGVHSVEIEVTDGQGGSAVQSFEIAATNRDSNSLPSITSVPDTRTNIEKLYTYQATATDPDGDLLLWILDKAPEGMVIDQNTGAISWQPGVDQVGTHTVAVKVVDALGAYVGQEFDLTVTGVNTPPQFVSTPITNGSANQAYSYQATATDAENDAVSYGLGVHPEGMVIDPNTGVINWTPPVGGSYDIEVLVFDAQGGSNKQVFTLEIESETINSEPTITTPPTIVEGNTAPTIISAPISDGAVNQPYTYQVTATDAENDNLLYGFASRPETMSIDPDTGEITWTPAVGGNYDIEVLVFDEHGARTSQEFTVDVEALPPNTAPTITSSPSYVADVDTAYTYQVVGEDKEGDVLNYELIAAPDGMVIDTATGAVTWANPVLGQHQVVVGVNDGFAGVAQGYTLTVKQNQAPVVNFSSPPAPTAIPGEVYSYDVPAYDPNGDRLFYTLDSVSTEKGFTIDELGRLRWTPEAEDAGNHSVTITITDEAGAEIEQSFTIEVVADTEAPKIDLYPGNIFVVDGEYQTDINSTVTFQAWATDNVGVTGVQLLVNGVPVAVDRDGIADVTFDELGTVELKAIALDTAGNIGEATATVDVFDFSDVDAPTVNIDLSGIEDNIVTAPVDIIGTINDDNLDYYVLEIGHADGEGEFVELYRSSTPVTDGVIARFDPSTVANDAYSLRVTAYDNGGNFASSEETVYVEGELKLGNFQLSFTDLTVPVAGIPISVTRTYDTLVAGSKDDFGYGWRLEFRDTNLRTSVGTDEQFDIFGLTSKGFQQGDAVYITLPGGKRETFIFEPELTPAGRMLAGLASSGGYAAGGKDYGLYHPKFVSESDSNNTLSVPEHILVRGESGQFAGIAGGLYNPANSAYGQKYILTTQEGIEYEIDAVSGDLKTATDTSGNKLTFTDNGITSDSGVSVTFGRDGQGRITSVIDPDGNEIKYQYDDNGDLIAVTDREKNTTKYGYSEERSHYLDEIVDPLGRTGVKTEYDESGRMSRLIDVNGEAVELTYDTENSTQTIEDANGNPTTYVYDDRGNVVTEVDPVGLITKRTYDADNNMLTETIITDESGEEGYTTTYTYDENGYETSVTDPLGNTRRYDYDQYGKLLSRSDALGNTTTYTYYGRNIASVTDALGNIVSYTYDRAGNRTSMTEGENDVTYYEYDSRGNRTKKTDALGNVTTYTHDTQGNILTETMTLTTSEGVKTLVTTKTYDSEGNETSVLDAEGNLTKFEYDANGNQTAIIDALGRKTVNRYDKKNNLIETILPDDTPSDDSDNLRTSTTYDANGNRTSVTDFAGNTTYYSYNKNNLNTKITAPDDSSEDLANNPQISVDYTKAGWASHLVDQSGNLTEYEYDAAGQISVTRQYNKNSNLVESTFKYDAAGQIISKTDALGRTTRYVYDALGQVTETIFHDETSIKTEYDAFGNEIAKTDQAGNTTYYEYDAEDRLTAVVDALGQRIEYQYDEAGNLVYQKDANNHITRFEFDGVGRQTAVIRPMGQESLTIYNEVGNPISITDFNGEVILYEYNTNNQLTKKLFEDGSTVEFDYNNAGKLESVVDERGTTSYTYNERGDLLSRTEPDGKTIDYTYNDAGKLESITTDSVTTTYTYDQFNFLDKVTANGEVTDYDYDAVGNLVQTTLANGVVETREYDDLYRLIGVDNTDADGNIISSYDYELDAVGNRTLVEELGGRTVAYEYDKLYRLLTEDITDSVNGNQTLSYVYDAVGNRLSLTDSVNGVTTYSYNDNDWLLSETTSGVTTNYTYDNNGNNLTKINPDEQVIYNWNQENRLIGAEITNSLGTTNLGYQYDANGVRVASTLNGIETRYLVDANREHAEVIEEYNPDGTTNVAYVHGLELISAERGGEIDYYVHDGHSGVRQLTDENGVVTDSYDYDGYGNLLNSTGDTENDYLYRGEQFDQELGMQYLRQRYYDTSVGRFASVDPFSGLVELPMSRHRYMYGNANPVTYLDPSGEISMTMNDVAAAGAIFAIFAGMLWAGSNIFNLSTNGNPRQPGYWTGELDLNLGIYSNRAGSTPIDGNLGVVLGRANLVNDYFGTHKYEVRGVYGGFSIGASGSYSDTPSGVDNPSNEYDVFLETPIWFQNQTALAGRFWFGDIGYTIPSFRNPRTNNEIGLKMGAASGIGTATGGIGDTLYNAGFAFGRSRLIRNPNED